MALCTWLRLTLALTVTLIVSFSVVLARPHKAETESNVLHYDADGYHEVLPTTGGRDGVASFGDFIGSGREYDWQEIGEQEILHSLEVLRNQRETPAKNVVFFIGDGMGVSTVTAARVFHAQSRQLEGKDSLLAWDKLDHVGLAMTYNTDRLVPDSAATATAFLCGEKAQYGTLGVNQKVAREDCEGQQGNELTSVIHKAMGTGRASGIVSTTRLTHATPAAAFAHAAERGWESSAPDGCRDIALQMIEDEINQNITIFMGGGRREFLPTDSTDPEYNDVYGEREDGRDLLEEWQDNMAENGFDEEQAVFVVDQKGFDDINVDRVERVLALFEPSHMQYEADRVNDTFGEPSLAEMVAKSIQILSRDNDGFILFVEGGRIDHAHHNTNAHRSLADTVALSDAVNVAMEMTDKEETLIIVSADHSHVFTISGNARIATSILGYDDNLYADDGKPFQTLAYTNGPGYFTHRTGNGSLETEQPRMDMTEYDEELLEDKDWLQDAGVPLDSEKHAGEEVAIYAHGPTSQLIRGTHQQSYIAHVMLYAMCIEGPGDMAHCTGGTSDSVRHVSATALSVTVAATIAFLLRCF